MLLVGAFVCNMVGFVYEGLWQVFPVLHFVTGVGYFGFGVMVVC